MLRAVLLAALMAGTLAGVLLTVVQQWQVIPLIQQAELGESQAVHKQDASGHSHDHNHEHGHDGWAPQGETERTMFTLLSNVLAGVGFSFLMVAAMVLARADGWRPGILWGLAAYGVFYVAPSLGLPPKLPGTVAAALEQQQLWWLATVAATAAGLSLLVFAGTYALKGVGLLLILVPHLLGAPVPQVVASMSEQMSALSSAFILATSLANLVFWLVMGAGCGYLLKRLLSAAPGRRLDSIGQH